MDKPSFWILAAVLYAAAFWFVGVLDFEGAARILMAGSIAGIAMAGWIGASNKEPEDD